MELDRYQRAVVKLLNRNVNNIKDSESFVEQLKKIDDTVKTALNVWGDV